MHLKFLATGVFLFLFSPTSFAQMRGVSAVRLEAESYEDAAKRTRSHGTLFGYGYDTPERFKSSLAQLNIQEIPELSSAEEMKTQFEFVRDTKFIEDSSLEFSRRLSWLFPDDGCYVRAELAAQSLVAQGFTAPKKIFVFGNLRASTKNSPQGFVRWWYHVAVTYRLGNVAYVYDPAIQPLSAITLQQWHEAIGGKSTQLEYAVCATGTVDPDGSCKAPKKDASRMMFAEQLNFLGEEWDRLEDLRRDPRAELGDSPPWKVH